NSTGPTTTGPRPSRGWRGTASASGWRRDTPTSRPRSSTPATASSPAPPTTSCPGPCASRSWTAPPPRPRAPAPRSCWRSTARYRGERIPAAGAPPVPAAVRHGGARGSSGPGRRQPVPGRSGRPAGASHHGADDRGQHAAAHAAAEDRRQQRPEVERAAPGAEPEELHELGEAQAAGRAGDGVAGGADRRALTAATGEVAAQRSRYQLDHYR